MRANGGLANGDSEAYWRGAREGRLLLQSCRNCGAVQFPPRGQCARCWEADLEWTEASGEGAVESFTVVSRAPTPSFRDRVPYVVASVQLQEGVRMITNVIGDDALAVQIGDRVRVAFEANAEGDVMPQFRRAED